MASIQNTQKLWVYVGIGFFITGIVFFAVALFSYNPYDPSFLLVDSKYTMPTNMCGHMGAQVAAFFFYLFGGASFVLFFPLVCALSIMIYRSIKMEWERLIAAIYFVIFVSVWCAMHGIDFCWSPYPGGAVGLSLTHIFVTLFDHIGCFVFVYTSILASFVLLFRYALVMGAHAIYTMFMMFCLLMHRYHVVEKTIHLLALLMQYLCIHPCRLLVKYFYSLFDGTAFENTDLLVPSDERYDFLMTELEMSKNSISSEVDTVVFSGSIHDVASIDTISTLQKTVADDEQCTTYMLPGSDVFIMQSDENNEHDLEKELHARAVLLQDKLKRFGVNGEVIAIKRGPVVTLFEYQPEADTKLSKIVALEDDLAMALSAMSIRTIAPIPGRAVVGFEVANVHRNEVLFSEIVQSCVYKKNTVFLPLVLGKGTVGEIVIVDLARMPHLLIAGSTGSGKSVALNGMLISLLCKRNPDELKLILIDPKRLEFTAFADIAHLLFPIVTNPYYAVLVLKWVVQEMERRYEIMAEYGAKSNADYNKRVQGTEKEVLPIIVVVIDELADLMLTTGREIEDLIVRITQMARAAGIHMIVATQRPSVDVVTGLIKANFPSRISFRVASRVDSRTILDCVGADRLLGRGDMLFLDAATSCLSRVHGAKIADEEIERVVSHIKSQRTVCYLDFNTITTRVDQGLSPEDDGLYKDVRMFLDEVDEVSISLLQRRFRIGFNRSARIITMLESQGLIMPTDGSKTRKVIR